MKSVNTFRNHVAPFIRDREHPDAPIVRRSHRDEIPDESAPQGVRYFERVRYDLRSTDDMDVLSGYLKVVVAQPERKAREKIDPATCEHPEIATEEAEVDRCTACDTVREIRTIRVRKICAVGDVTPPGTASPPAPP